MASTGTQVSELSKQPYKFMRAYSVKVSLLKFGLLSMLLLLLGSGCKRRSWQRIPNDKLEQLLTELYTARGVGQTLYLSSDQQDSIYASILKSHGVSQEDLDSTIYYLSASKAKLLQKIIAQSSASIQREVEILERTTGFFKVGLEGDEGNFYSPLPDSLSCRVTPLSTYPIRISKEQSSYLWKVALADIPNLPDTIHQIEIQGLVSGTRLPEEFQMPYIAISKQLDATPPPLAMESASMQLPIGGVFSLTLGSATPENASEPTEEPEPTSYMDSISSSLTDLMSSDPTGSVVGDHPVSRPRKEPVHTAPHFSVGDTISISIYSQPSDYLSTQSLHFRLQELRIVAR